MTRKVTIVVFSLVLILSLSINCAPTPAPTSTPTPAPTPAAMLRYTLSTSVNPSDSGTIDPANGTYDAGTKVTLTAIPAQGRIFEHWSGDATGTSKSITLVMDSDKSVTANFKAQYTLNTNVDPGSGGTITPASGTYDAGSEVTITAVATPGYAFDHWSGDTTSTYSSVTIVMDSDKSVTAHFKTPEPAPTPAPTPSGIVILSHSLSRVDGIPVVRIEAKNDSESVVGCAKITVNFLDSAGEFLFGVSEYKYDLEPGQTYNFEVMPAVLETDGKILDIYKQVTDYEIEVDVLF